MIRFGDYRLLLAVALGTPLLLAGCRTRTEFVGETLPDPPAHVVSERDVTSPEPAADETPDSEDDESSASTGDVSWDGPDESSEPVALDQLSAASPKQILEEAGGVIEQDKHGRPVGVDLTAAHVSAEVVRAVAELSELQWVDMRKARITDADLAIIGSLPRLQLLALGDTLITDAGLKHLAHQQDLRFLSLDRTAVTDAGLMTLAGLPRLEGISLSGTSVSQAGAKAYEAATPGCNVILDADAAIESPTSRPVAPPEPMHNEPMSQSDIFWDLDSEDAQPIAIPQPQRSFPATPNVAQTGETLSAVLQRKLLDPDVLQALSQHLMARKNYGKAARALEALLVLQPGNQQTRYDLGIALARSGQLEAAQPHLSQAVGDATALYNLGVIAYELDRPSRSEWYFARAVDMAPDFVEARQWLRRLRQTTAITPASHTPQPVDTQDLVNLLMSEFGSTGERPARSVSGAGIEIVPARRPKPQQNDPSVW